MTPKKSLLLAALAVTVLALGGCAGASGSSPSSEAEGEPVAGGTLRAIETGTLSGLDPAQLYSPGQMPITGNSLYGQLVTADPESGDYVCSLCESFGTEDGGKTWTFVTREGLTFTDGTPFDAEAIKYNWDRHADPATASASIGMASQIESIEVVDDVTVKVTTISPLPEFPEMFTIYALNWIASPTALAKGPEEFNKNPIGAGPFVFESWTQGGTLKLTKNDDYFDAPRPYLDAIEITAVPDNTQRNNALLSGQADLVLNTTDKDFLAAEAAGFENDIYLFNGGLGYVFNTAAEPFNDVRARQAVAYAINMEEFSDAVTSGHPNAPVTLFNSDSPFYADIPIQEYDADKAQGLFDELADEGKPVEIEYTLFPGAQVFFDAFQAQMSKYDNVTVTVDNRDTAEIGKIRNTGEFDMIVSGLSFTEPNARLPITLSGEADGGTNYARLNDPEMNALLAEAVAAPELEEQVEIYREVQEKFAELVPYLLYTLQQVGVSTATDVNGVVVYNNGSPATAGIWIQP